MDKIRGAVPADREERDPCKITDMEIPWIHSLISMAEKRATVTLLFPLLKLVN